MAVLTRPAAMTPARAPLLPARALLLPALVSIATLVTGLNDDELIKVEPRSGELGKSSHSRALASPELPSGCLYDGRWYIDQASVVTREACLRCVCARGALACRRRTCQPLPDPPPHHCHVLHRRGSCCPEIHCPDGVTMLEQESIARTEDTDVATPASVTHVCVEGGTVYAGGSAMGSSTACEQCFCLGGARRCVRPRCLPPPPGCRARPAPGACCPQKYYCEHTSTKPPDQRNPHDCKIEDHWISEGERVTSPVMSDNCTRCFCLRGSVRCQPLACAPPLLGCKPLVQPGECCPQQYNCEHHYSISERKQSLSLSHNSLISTKYEDRSLHSSRATKIATTPRSISHSTATKKSSSTTAEIKQLTIVTTKVKRKTKEPSTSVSNKPTVNTTITTQRVTTNTHNIFTTTPETISTSEYETMSTEQPEGTVKIMINGTINCTAELSSTSLPLNFTANETERITNEALPRLPYAALTSEETHTFNPNDIITDSYIGFDENETFVINVTSSLNTNTNISTSTTNQPHTTRKTPKPIDLPQAMNVSKKNKDKPDYDYDYAEPTLPPSLPNLKIIPFVAADAVVEEETPSKNNLKYTVHEREDKFPIYYPEVEAKEIPLATRREDVFPIKYPVFTHEKLDSTYLSLDHEINLPKLPYTAIPSASSDFEVPSLNEFLLTASLGSRVPGANKAVPKISAATSTMKLTTPSVNLFSPPVETEGGFIPKGPGIADEFYALYTSTPPGPSVLHLTTSMPLDTKSECDAGEGQQVSDGETISLACSICTCAWGELHCSPKTCHTPVGCRRQPASKRVEDLCCGKLICDAGTATTTSRPLMSTNVDKINTSQTIKEKLTKDPEKITTIAVVALNMSTATPPDVANSSTKFEFHKPILQTVPSKINIKNEINTTEPLTIISTTEKVFLTTLTPEITTLKENQFNQTNSTSQEYEYEEEEDGFSFGNVLKLLLSESYDSSSKKKTTTTAKVTVPIKVTAATKTTTVSPLVTTKIASKPPVPSFLPMPQLRPPPKKTMPNTFDSVNSIDNLVLGEATAIRKPSPYPAPSFKPVTTEKSVTTTLTTTKISIISTKASVAQKEAPDKVEVLSESRKPVISSLPGLGAGFLKLAGCNIYGRMYRVDKVIAELSTGCQECRCTELGVQCRSLKC